MKKNSTKREDVLQKGIEILKKQGYHGTGISDIVEATDLCSKGAFYNYFKSKEAFVLEAIEYYQLQKKDAFDFYLDDTDYPHLQRLLNLFDSLIAHYEKVTDCTQGCLVGNLSQEMGDQNEKIREVLENSSKKNIVRIGHLLEQAQKQGTLNLSRHPHHLARFIWNSWEGALLRMKTSKSALDLKIFRDFLENILLK
ncbi:MAG: TetR family transcriptional regulator C-terminal domain-containing protein [Microscillaceae bacterium]|nr:TetR family transcriptional regulator C-terminal domain-containing protein [Microscillaceae bacterium]